MARAAIAFNNLADLATLTPSSEQVTLPASNLQHPDIARKWRSVETVTAAVVADLLVTTSIDTVAMIGTIMSSAGQARLRISTSDSSGLAADLHDSGWVSVNSTYNQYIALLAAAVTGRYVRIDLSDVGADYVEAGRLFIGSRSQFSINFGYNWSITTTDRSTIGTSRGGQTLIWPANIFRSLDLPFEQISEADRNAFIETVERVNAAKTDVLFVIDPDSNNLAKDSVWGLIKGSAPIVNPFPGLFSKQYKIEERL